MRHLRFVASTLLLIFASACDAPELAKSRNVPVKRWAPIGGGQSLIVTNIASPTGLPPDHQIDWQLNPVMRELGVIGLTMTESRYSHVTRVDEKAGVYEFDCSGMVSWVLRKAAPTASHAIRAKLAQRPLARDFQQYIARLPSDETRHGWRRVARIDDARPGDIVAWVKPKSIRSPFTGHVAFIVLPPTPVPGGANNYLIRIADASSLLHDDDTREGRSGFGLGTIVLRASPIHGAPVAYGWVGMKWRQFETEIAIGRAVK